MCYLAIKLEKFTKCLAGQIVKYKLNNKKKNYIYNFLIADDLYPLNYIHSKGKKCRTYRMKMVFPVFVSETLSNFRSLPPFFVKESL